LRGPYRRVIVDFKADEEIGAQLHRYQRQVASSAEAVFKSVQKPNSAYILQI
jgi:hypothetical protein